jgi:hypothetical protein
VLNKVKQQKSPLKDALGEGAPTQGLFEDLPPYETYPFIDEHHLRQVLEAWFSLFGKYLEDHGLLITLDRHIMKYVTEIFEEFFSEKTSLRTCPTARLKVPDMSHLPMEELLRVREQNLKGKYINALTSLVESLHHQDALQRDEIVRLSKDVEESFPGELASRQLHMTLTHFPRLSDDENAHRDPVLAGLFDKTIILLED